MHICEIAPRREAPEILPWKFAPFEEERARGMPGARCTRSLMRAIGVVKYAHEYSQRKHRIHPASPTQWFTDYTRSSRGPLAVLTPSVRCNSASQPGRAPRDAIETLTPTLGRQNHTTSPSASAPVVDARSNRSRRKPPCDPLRPTLLRPPHPVPTFVTTREAPLVARTGWRE